MRNLVRGVKKFATAPRSERRLVIAVLLMSRRIARHLESDGYASTRTWLGTVDPPDPGSEVSPALLRRADTAMRRMPWNPKCLERSLAIWWVAGDRAVIRLGVAPSSGEGEHRFHAWVERDGSVINDAPNVASEFLPLIGHAVETADPQLFD